jgi:hypothetical protein
MIYILDCFQALDDIDRDILHFSEHQKGSDESLKETANLFLKEFLECREQIETHLNKIL